MTKDKIAKQAQPPSPTPLRSEADELQVYQIELKMRNDQLRCAQRALEESRDRYMDLYEFAPIGYLTLDGDGTITEANLTGAALLKIERSKLLRRRFGLLVAPQDRDRWNRLFADITRKKNSAADYRLEIKDGAEKYFYAQLNCAYQETEGKPPGARIAFTDISVLRKAQQSMHEWQEFIDNAPWGMAICAGLDEPIIKHANPAYARMHGYTIRELRDTSANNLYAPESHAYLAHYTKALHDTGHCTFECVRLRKDGSTFPSAVEMSAIEGADGTATCIASVTDITERKRVEAITRKMESQLKATLNAIPDLLFEVGLNGRYYDYYTSRPELLAVPPEVFLGKTAQEFLSPEAAIVATQALHEANETGTSLGKQIKLKLPKGTMWFELSIARKPVAAGEEPRFVVLSRDITERKNLEKEIQRQRNEMEELQKLHVASMTTAAIAHELNQPLLAIASYSQAALIMLQAGKPDLDKIRKAIEGSEQQAHRAGKAIRELLNFLSLKEFTSEAFDLNREIVDVLNTEKAEHEMQFHSILKLEQELPLVLANRSHVQRVLRNLLRNGIEAMQQAGVPLPAITVIVRTMKDEGVAQITIIDNGPGFKKEAIHRLFEPFFTSKPNGIGMGLAISRSLVEANGGQLWVDPQEGPGATFHLTLPFAT